MTILLLPPNQLVFVLFQTLCYDGDLMIVTFSLTRFFGFEKQKGAWVSPSYGEWRGIFHL